MLSLFAAAALAAPSPPPCSPQISIHTSVAEIGLHPNRFMGKCVTVAGLFLGVAMYGSVKDMYLTFRFGSDGNYDRQALRRGRVGLYSPNNELRALRLEAIPRIEVTGTVDSCERRSAAARAQEKADLARGKVSLFMLSGYCHFNGGAVVNAVSWSFDSTQRYERLSGEAARENYGNLVEMESGWPFAADLRSTSAAFLAALRAGNRSKLMELHDFTNPGQEFNRKVMRLLLDRTDSPFVQIRANPTPQEKIFVDAYEVEQWREGKRSKLPFGLACYCRTKDCKGRWPISRNDADNWITRPYACVGIRKEDWPGGKLIVDLPVGNGRWLAEPEVSAFHPR